MYLYRNSQNNLLFDLSNIFYVIGIYSLLLSLKNGHKLDPLLNEFAISITNIILKKENLIHSENLDFSRMWNVKMLANAGIWIETIEIACIKKA